MTRTALPPAGQMYQALVERDASYDGIFFIGVKTTGIFCRPTCTAKKPRRENVEFFGSIQDALSAGYRACKRCRPTEQAGRPPEWVNEVLEAVEQAPHDPWRDRDLVRRGWDPARLRRWFKKHYGMTFQAFWRSKRMAVALGKIRNGQSITSTALDSGYESLSGFCSAVKRASGRSAANAARTKVIHMDRLATPLGSMIAAAVDEGLCLLEFADRRLLPKQWQRVEKSFAGIITPGSHHWLRVVRRELDEYFDGRRRDFTVPVVYPGTAFQIAVWDGLRSIPYGRSISYEQLAATIGKPQAVRAVGRANGDNRLAIIVPCHRVIGADGRLRGYGGGLWRKQFLLDLEQG